MNRQNIFKVLLLFFLLASAGCAKYPCATDSVGGSVAGQAVVRTAMSGIGSKYKPGGTSPATGFDCSGLVCWAYEKHGIKLPRTTTEQKNIGRTVRKNDLRPGDLVVFKVRRGLHTGIYSGNGKFVHSPSRGKLVREDDINSNYWRDKFISGRRHKQIQ